MGGLNGGNYMIRYTNLHTIGDNGELLALDFLENNGFTIIEHKYRFRRFGEIDIIAQKENLIVFIEVKTRFSERFGGALYSIGPKKKNTILKTARKFISENDKLITKKTIFRFDLIAIKNETITWVEDIIRR